MENSHSNETFVILSLKEIYFEKMLAGRKKYEYRRRFLNRPSTAFIYLVSPVKTIVGVAKFGQPIVEPPHVIAEIRESEEPNMGAYDGMLEYLKGLEKGYAIPILSVEKIEPVTLDELRNRFKFVPPQSYMTINDKPELLTFLQSRPKLEKWVVD